MNRYATLLALTVSLVSMMPASADEFITRQTVVGPAQSIFVPSSTIVTPSTVTRTTETTTIGSPDTFMVPTATIVEPDTVSSRTVIMGTTSAPGASSTVVSTNMGPFPVFSNRLAAMSEQVDNSLAHGWVTQVQANSLMAEHDRIAALIANRSCSLQESNSIERQLNFFNLAIQDSMNANNQTAGLNRFTY